MNKKTHLGFITTAVVCWPLLASAEQYLCVANDAVAFLYNEGVGEWEGAAGTSDSKYLIAEIAEDESQHTTAPDPYKFHVTEFGDELPSHYCEGFTESARLICEGNFRNTSFIFNKKNGRFLHIYAEGYWNSGPGDEFFMTDKNSDTPYMKIGECSPF